MVFKSRLFVSTVLAGLAAAAAANAQPAAPPPAAHPAPGAAQRETQGALSPSGPEAATPQSQAGVLANRQGASVTPENTPGGGDTLIAEVVVTAEKREQSLQQVPVAVSAFTAAKRDLIGIQSVVDQTNYTPGLTYQPSLDRLSLRGVGRLTNVKAVDSGTAIYVDGVFTTSTFEAGRDPIFIERTEILRGPQGTLYGRNAIGGAYNVISKRPTRDWSGEARMTVANYDRGELAAVLRGPITDWLRFSIGYQKIKQDEGFINNISGAPGRRFTTNFGVRDQDYIEAQFAGELGKLDFWAYYGKNKWNNAAPPGTVTNGGTLAPPETNLFVGAGSNSLAPNAGFGFTNGLNTQFFGPVRGNPALVTGDPFNVQTNVAFKNTLHDNNIARLHLTYHFDQFDVKYLGGFQNYNYFYTNDTDQTSVTRYQIPLTPGGTCAQLQAAGLCQPLTVFPNYVNDYREDVELQSHEINVTSTWDKPLQYVLGLYWFKEKTENPVNVYAPDQPQVRNPFSAIPGQTVPPNPQGYLLRNSNFLNSTSKAVFGQVDYKIFNDFKLTGGVRYTQDDKKVTEEQRGISFLTATAAQINPAILGTLIGGPGIPPLGVPAIPNGAADITRAAAGGLTAAQIAAGLQQQGVVGLSYNPVNGILQRRLQGGFNAVTGTAGIEWTPDRRTLAYFRYARGYKAGAFNVVQGSTFSTFPYSKPEQMNSFEAGLKKDWTRRLQTNASVFYQQYYDAQVPVTITQANSPNIGVFYNVPESEIKGFELETVWQPIDRLNILFTYAYLEASITEACCIADPNDPTAIQPGATPATGPEALGSVDPFTGQPSRGQDLEGNDLPLSPRNKLAVNATYTFDFGRFGTLTPSASYIWRDQQFSSIFNRAYNQSPSTDQVDLRLTYKPSDNRFTLIAFARNVTDNVNFETLGGTRFSTGQVFQNYVLQEPRTYGVQLQARF